MSDSGIHLSRSRDDEVTVEFALAGRDRILVGRGRHCDVRLGSPIVSREHAELRQRDGRWTLRDLGSGNGTYLNGRLLTEETEVGLEDVVKIGPFRLTYDGERVHSTTIDAGTRIEVRGLTRQVVDRQTGAPLRLLDDVELAVMPREFVGLLGPSGCGKTTFVNAVSGRQPANAGTVSYDGDNLYNHFDAWKQGIGFVPQDLIFHEDLPLADALRYASRLRLPSDTTSEEIEKNIDRVLATVGLEHRRGNLIRNLSGGEKKRVCVAIELLSRPSVLFLDEATSGLDLGTEAQMMRLFRAVADGGTTTLIVTHHVSSLDMCDLVGYFVRGRLAYFGPPDGLRAYFDAPSMREVYLQEATRPPEEWAASYRGSEDHQRFVADRMARAPEATDVKTGAALGRRKTAGALRQFGTLLKRRVHLLFARKWALLLNLALAPMFAGLMGIVLQQASDENAFQLAMRQVQIVTITPLVVFFLSIFGAIREIVDEGPIYRHERFAGLRILPYLASKALPLAVVCMLQLVLFLGGLHLLVDVRVAFVDHAVTLLPLAFAAMLLGLTLSAAVHRADKALLLMLLVIIPQMLFSDAIIRLSGTGKAIAQLAVPVYWAHDALKQVLPEPIRRTLQLMPGSPKQGEPLTILGLEGWGLDTTVLWAFVALFALLAVLSLAWRDGPRGRLRAMP